MLGQEGILDVGAKPPARQRTLEVLSSILDEGHELSEDEMVELFAARGSDFDAVCSAAGASLPPPDCIPCRREDALMLHCCCLAEMCRGVGTDSRALWFGNRTGEMWPSSFDYNHAWIIGMMWVKGVGVSVALSSLGKLN